MQAEQWNPSYDSLILLAPTLLYFPQHKYFVIDINECDESDPTHNCHVNAVCTNHDGSFECVCVDGYNGNGIECTKRKYFPTRIARTVAILS